MLDETIQVSEFRQDFSLPGVVFLNHPVALENFAQHDGGALRPLQLLLAGALQSRGRANFLLAQRVALLDLGLNEFDGLTAMHQQLDGFGWVGELDCHVSSTSSIPRRRRSSRTDSLSVTAGGRTNRIIGGYVLCE